MDSYCIANYTDNDTVIFENVFTDDINELKSAEPFEVLKFQAQHNIILSGDYIGTVRITKHIKALMSDNMSNTQFTHLHVYYVCDGVVDCNITLSTIAVPLTKIIEFVSTLLANVDTSRRNDFTLEFTRPYFDFTEFALETAR